MVIKTHVWLKEIKVIINSVVKSQIFSLNYIQDGIEYYKDIGGFRPDPSSYLKPNKKYKAELTIIHEYSPYLKKDVPIFKKVRIFKGPTYTSYKDFAFIR